MAHFTVENLGELNDFLAKNNYLNGDLPGADDVRIFNALKGLPPKEKFPEVYFWYLLLTSFTPAIREQWTAPAKQAAPPKQAAPKDEKKAAPPKGKEPAAPAKAEEEEVDLFGDDDAAGAEEAKKLAEEQKKKLEEGKKKKQVIAKTIVIFDVKVYEATDMALLQKYAKKIKDEINPPGLVWGQEVKFEEVAFGAKKIVLSMIIEDDKVLTDDIFEQILAWEDDIQSVDISSMQKV